MKRKKIIYLFILIILVFCTILVLLDNNVFLSDIKKKKKVFFDIKNYYNEYVVTNNDSAIYDDDLKEIGMISKNVELSLDDINSSKDNKYFKVKDFDNNYYIKYSDVKKINKINDIDNRYKEYIVFNENIITNDKVSFYDNEDSLIYSFNKSFIFPIIIKDNDRYGIEFNNRLLFIKKENVKSIEKANNTDKSNSSGIGVLNYHAFYDDSNEEEKANCNTSICHSKTQFKTHLDYFKENSILSLRMNEVEMYIDGKIQLPKSVLITIDDGDRTKIAVDMLTEYKMYGTIFLITSWFDPKKYYVTDYIELHSHSDNLHNPGVCPTGQGGGIQCLSEDEIQKDLKNTREKLNNTTYFCYPFYEYNDYSIKMLKEAGFTMAFIGESKKSDNLVHVDSNKYKLRRFVVVDYTTMDDLKDYFNQIK